MQLSQVLTRSRRIAAGPKSRPVVTDEHRKQFALSAPLVIHNFAVRHKCMDCGRRNNYTGTAICEDCRAHFNLLPHA